MRDIERLITFGTIAGSLVFGVRHNPAWFALMLAVLALFVYLADRALRRQIGPRAWPSEGYARFAFNTNLYFAFRQLLLGGVLFALAGTAAELIAG